VSAQSVNAAKKRRKLLLKLGVLAIVLSAAVWVVKQKKDVLVREGADFLQRFISRETQMDVKIGGISGKLSGHIRFRDVRLEDPRLPAGLRLVFRADEVEVRFRPLDFLTKKYDSKLHLSVRGAELYVRPHIKLRRERFNFVAWARRWVVTQRRHLDIELSGLKVVYGAEERTFSGIHFSFEDDEFRLRLPLSHMDVMGMDLSTQLDLRGHFDTGALKTPDAMAGTISTEGTVVNWTPLPWEASFDFLLTPDEFRFHSADLFGGIQVDGGVDLAHDGDVELAVDAEQYPLKNVEPFQRTARKLEGKIDLRAKAAGDWRAPDFDADVRITDGRIGNYKFKAMVMHLAGVYPTLQMSESQVLLEDNSAMRFAPMQVEFLDLFTGSLYRRLIESADQNSVVVGDWEFKRPASERTEFRMQRQLGEHAGMYIRKFNEPSEEKLDEPDTHATQVGFEFRLEDEDVLKFEANEEESFVGVERKLSF
jgi:hypothetical protein